MKLYYHKTDGGAEYLCSEAVEGTNEGSVKSLYVIRIDGDITKDAELLSGGPTIKAVPLRGKSSNEMNHVYHCPNCKGEKTIWTLEDYAEKGAPVCGVCGEDMEVVRTKESPKP